MTIHDHKLDPFHIPAVLSAPRLREPPVLIDCDGVLADFLGAAKASVIETGGENAWDDAYLSRWGFLWDGTLPKAVQSAVDSHTTNSRWWSNLPVLPGAKLGFKRLLTATKISNIYVVTAPSDYCPMWSDARKHWLNREFGVPANQVVIGGSKAAWLGDGIFFEDRMDTLVCWMHNGDPVHRLGIYIESPATEYQYERLTEDERILWAEHCLMNHIVTVDNFAAGVEYLLGTSIASKLQR